MTLRHEPSSDDILDLMRAVAAEQILPRFRRLADADIDQKAPGDFVTVADREAERVLTRELTAMAPGCLVIGEEACFLDPALESAAGTADHAFLVDPVDGTRNFVRGSANFAVMIAEVRSGETVRAWILQPALEHVYVAEAGAGATRDGEPLPVREGSPSRPQGVASQRRLIGFDAGASLSPIVFGAFAAGIDYPRVATGAIDFVVYKNLHPWDHAPGSLLLRETGGVARMRDGRNYRPGEAGQGMIGAGTDAIWGLARSAFRN